jgi:hypothetical protein
MFGAQFLSLQDSAEEPQKDQVVLAAQKRNVSLKFTEHLLKSQAISHEHLTGHPIWIREETQLDSS